MDDPWVRNTQTWLNRTYSVQPGWVPVPVTGRTGWPTMYALTRALQIELKISPLSDNFGPATLAAVEAISPINNATSNKNIIRIIQGGMYCKGYDGGGGGELNGVYSSATIAGVRKLHGDIGLQPGDGFMTAKVFKALLTALTEVPQFCSSNLPTLGRSVA
jgi:peptidoglycan hydrolase-like protein with peptidoglycan-binding domain